MAETVKKRHPIRAAFWGLLIGLGLVIWFTFAQPVIGLDNVVNVLIRWGIIILAAIVLAIIVAMILPAKKPKGPPPDEPASVIAATDTAATEPADEAGPSDGGGETEDASE